MRRRRHRMLYLGKVPHVAWSCRIGKRQAASNAIGNILRAVKSGRCQRARIILDDYSFRSVSGCIDYETMKRLHHRVERCRERA